MTRAERIIANYDGGYLDLSGCTLPENLKLPDSIGGYLYLSGCTGWKGLIHDCGNNSRTIAAYNHAEKGRVVSLGCFIGTLDECEAAISGKYSNKENAERYIAKVREAFKFNENA